MEGAAISIPWDVWPCYACGTLGEGKDGRISCIGVSYGT